MARTNKNFETKKQEIIKIALHLFLENGYENTSIHTILQAASISKGAMYHYFISKEDVLDAVINFVIDQDASRFQTIMDDKNISAVEKLQMLITSGEKPPDVSEATLYAERNKNSIFDYRSKELSLKRTVPDIAKIIKQGVEEGIFYTDYPDEMAECFYILTRSLFEVSKEMTFAEQRKRIDACIYVLENCLGRNLGEFASLKQTLLSQFEKMLGGHIK